MTGPQSRPLDARSTIKLMKKVLFGIFAHPDDEAFGPSAYLYRAAQNGTDVHLILATDGENGTNCDAQEDLGAIRLKEWRTTAALIGTRSAIALHCPDGTLSNTLYLEIAEKVLQHIKKTLKTYENVPVEVDFLTFEANGISGHLDHIAMSFITTFVYLKLRSLPLEGVTFDKLKYFCLPKSMAPTPNTDWIYMAAGRLPEEIDEVHDYSDINDKKLEIMQCHYSQREDMESVLEYHKDTTNKDCLCDHFIYYKD